MKTIFDETGPWRPGRPELSLVSAAAATGAEFEHATRCNARDFARGGIKHHALLRLGLRCVPVSVDAPPLAGPVYRVARARGFECSALERRLGAMSRRGQVESLSLVRHAATLHNRRGRLSGAWFDAEAGICEQGRSALARLRIPRGALIVHSPLARARQTAEALAAMDPEGSAVVRPLRHGTEMCFGPFEGQRFETLARDPRFRRLYVHGDTVASFPGAECFADVLLRAGRVLDELLDEVDGSGRSGLPVIFVGHAMINHALRILAGELYDAERGHYLCNGVDERSAPMSNGSMRLVAPAERERAPALLRAS